MDVRSDARPIAPVAWWGLAAVAAISLVLHLVTNGRYGIFRDELYYLACADHLAWGYVDHPPFSIAVLAGWKALFGDSLGAIRVVPALMGGAQTVLAGLIARELGGRRLAQVLAGVAAATAPVYLAVFGFYSMNAFDLVVWSLCAWVLARWIRTGDARCWPVLGVVLGVGLLNKLSVVVLGASVGAGLLLTERRRSLRTRGPWIAAGIALVIALPHAIWQVVHGWPTLEFIANAKRLKIAVFSPAAFFVEQIFLMNPVALLLWGTGLVALLITPRFRRYRIFAWMYLAALGIFVAQVSKPYYLAGAYVSLLAAGAVAFEAWSGSRRWIPVAITVVVAASGAALAPLAVPVLPVETLLRYQSALHVAPKAEERGVQSALPQIFADRFGWEEMASTVAAVYDSLPPGERPGTAILCGNYGEAGAIRYFGRRYGLPEPVSTHNSFYLWGYGEREPERIIVVGFGESELRALFDQVTTVAIVRSLHSMPYERNARVYLVSGPRMPLEEAWRRAKNFI